MTEQLIFNGILENGAHAYESLSVEAMAARVRAMMDPTRVSLFAHAGMVNRLEGGVRPLSWIDPNDLEQAGWAVIFPTDDQGELREALAPLLNRRKAQANQQKNLYQELEYQPDEQALEFLFRVGAALANPDPKKLPYYLLIVGGPDQIPFDFQFALDVQYAVGRIQFDTLDEYRQYANNVVEAEERTLQENRQKQATFFGPRHEGDSATRQSHDFLIQKLSALLQSELNGKAQIQALPPQKATKAELLAQLRGPGHPDFLFTAGHCLIYEKITRKGQEKNQGALICGDWLGQGYPRKKHLFRASDLEPESDLNGMIAFFFGCFSGATPMVSSFPPKPGDLPEKIVAKPFIAHLPKAMLSREKGCLAVVAHMDSSFPWFITGLKDKDYTQVFQDCFYRLLSGGRLGWSMDAFHLTYAERMVFFNQLVKRESNPAYKRNDQLFIELWKSMNDARNYLILGDPACALPGKILKKGEHNHGN